MTTVDNWTGPEDRLRIIPANAECSGEWKCGWLRVGGHKRQIMDDFDAEILK